MERPVWLDILPQCQLLGFKLGPKGATSSHMPVTLCPERQYILVFLGCRSATPEPYDPTRNQWTEREHRSNFLASWWLTCFRLEYSYLI